MVHASDRFSNSLLLTDTNKFVAKTSQKALEGISALRPLTNDIPFLLHLLVTSLTRVSLLGKPQESHTKNARTVSLSSSEDEREQGIESADSVKSLDSGRKRPIIKALAP